MSLLINGMDMPKCCDDCPFYDSAGFCALDPTREFDDYNHKCPDDCTTLVEIPTPHGRLIDADRLIVALKNSVYANAIFHTPALTVSQIEQLIEHQPTVIEKENAQ